MIATKTIYENYGSWIRKNSELTEFLRIQLRIVVYSCDRYDDEDYQCKCTNAKDLHRSIFAGSYTSPK